MILSSDLVVANIIIGGQQDTYRHLTTRAFPLLADSGMSTSRG
jgi:hypothetical protein